MFKQVQTKQKYLEKSPDQEEESFPGLWKDTQAFSELPKENSQSSGWEEDDIELE